MTEDDKRISGLYRGLPKEEPPARLDVAIIEAARRPGLRRWYFPVSIAAVIVLSAVVTFRIWYERPDFDGALPAPEPAPEKPGQEETKAADPRLAARPGAAQRDAVTGVAAPRETARPLKAPRPETPPSAFPAPAAPAPAAAVERAATLGTEESPEKWLERIAELRCKGRGREADEELGIFKRRYPDFRIPEAKPCQ